MIDDTHQDPRIQSLRDALTVPRSTVNRQDELNAIFCRRLERPLWYSVAIAVAMRDEALGDRTDRTQRADHDRGAGEPVCVEIADHEDRFPRLTRGAQPGDQSGRVWQKLRRVQSAVSWVEEPLDLLWFTQAPQRKELGQRIAQLVPHLDRVQRVAERVHQFAFWGFDAPTMLGIDSAT